MAESERLVLAQESARVLFEQFEELDRLLAQKRSYLAVKMAECFQDTEALEALVERERSRFRAVLGVEAMRFGQV